MAFIMSHQIVATETLGGAEEAQSPKRQFVRNRLLIFALVAGIDLRGTHLRSRLNLLDSCP